MHARKAWLKELSPTLNLEVPPLRYDWVDRHATHTTPPVMHSHPHAHAHTSTLTSTAALGNLRSPPARLHSLSGAFSGEMTVAVATGWPVASPSSASSSMAG